MNVRELLTTKTIGYVVGCKELGLTNRTHNPAIVPVATGSNFQRPSERGELCRYPRDLPGYPSFRRFLQHALSI